MSKIKEELNNYHFIVHLPLDIGDDPTVYVIYQKDLERYNRAFELDPESSPDEILNEEEIPYFTFDYDDAELVTTFETP